MRSGRGSGASPEQRQLLLNAWGRIDGAAAVNEIIALGTTRAEKRSQKNKPSGHKTKGDHNEDLYNALSGWATTDSKAASEFAQTLTKEGIRTLTPAASSKAC